MSTYQAKVNYNYQNKTLSFEDRLLKGLKVLTKIQEASIVDLNVLHSGLTKIDLYPKFKLDKTLEKDYFCILQFH